VCFVEAVNMRPHNQSCCATIPKMTRLPLVELARNKGRWSKLERSPH